MMSRGGGSTVEEVEFLNGTDLNCITNKNGTVLLKTSTSIITGAEFCQTFVQNGRLWFDFIPQLNRKYVAPVPDDAIVSRNEKEVFVGRYGIIIDPESPAGRLLQLLIQAKEQQKQD